MHEKASMLSGAIWIKAHNVFKHAYYTVYRLEVTFLKLLEMIEKWIKFYFWCLYLKEYKKGFAFLTKYHYFESRGGLNCAF